MRNLDHPNITKLIDFSESRQYYYIVLELCPGGELFHQIVRLTYFSEDLSRHVITQVAQAIEYLHETSGVVHRFVGRQPNDVDPELTLAKVTSNPKISCFTRFPMSQQKTLSPSNPAMKIKKMRESLFLAMAQVALARSSSQISVCPR
jgi:serine/threonine protein kinase